MKNLFFALITVLFATSAMAAIPQYSYNLHDLMYERCLEVPGIDNNTCECFAINVDSNMNRIQFNSMGEDRKDEILRASAEPCVVAKADVK